MPFRQSNGLGQFLNGGEPTGLHAPPPTLCPADSVQTRTEIELRRI